MSGNSLEQKEYEIFLDFQKVWEIVFVLEFAFGKNNNSHNLSNVTTNGHLKKIYLELVIYRGFRERGGR